MKFGTEKVVDRPTDTDIPRAVQGSKLINDWVVKVQQLNNKTL